MTAPITEIPGWAEMSSEQLHATLSEIIETRKPSDATKFETAWATGARGLRDFLPGPTGWGGMLSKLTDLGYNDVATQLAAGMDFGDPATQAMIDQLGIAAPDVFTPERVTVLKSWGIDRRTRWTELGGEGEVPDLATIAAMQATAKLQEFARLLGQRITAAVLLAASEPGATEQTVRDAAITQTEAES